MIDRRDYKYSINLDISIPHDDERIIKAFCDEMKEITDKCIGEQSSNSLLISQMEYEIRRLLDKEEYRGIMIKNNDFYNEEIWDLNKLLEVYKENYPERFENKKEYTNMDVNNMLFELKEFSGVIGNYNSPAVPFDIPSVNDKIFDSSIRVEVPVINIGSQKEHDEVRDLFFLSNYD